MRIDDKKFMRGSVCDSKLLFGWLNVRLFSNDHYTTRTVGIVWVLIFWQNSTDVPESMVAA